MNKRTGAAWHVAVGLGLLVGAADAPAQGLAQPPAPADPTFLGPPAAGPTLAATDARAALLRAVQQLDALLAAGDFAAVARQFLPDHPAAHRQFLAEVERAGGGPGASTLVGELRQLPTRVAAVFERPLRNGRTVRTVLTAAIEPGDAGARAVPTFAAVLPRGSDPEQVLRGAFRCPPCNFELQGADGWLCVPQLPCRAQAIEGAIFYLAGTSLACEVSVRAPAADEWPAQTAQALFERLVAAGSGFAPPGPWLPPAHRAAPPTGLRGAAFDVRPNDGPRSWGAVVQCGGLQQIFLAQTAGPGSAWPEAALQALLGSYRLLRTDGDDRDVATGSLRHHTGSTLLGTSFRNEKLGIALDGPTGWRAQLRCTTKVVRAVWTSDAGSRLWLSLHPTPHELDHWCPASADQWLDQLLGSAGLQLAPGSSSTWRDDPEFGGQVRDLECRSATTDPHRPPQRLLRAHLRDDVLVVLDAIPAVAGDLPTLRGALLALQGCR